MQELVSIVYLLGLVGYSVATCLFYFELTGRRLPAAATRAATWSLAAAGTLHATHFVAGSLLSRVCPVTSIHFAISLAALAAIAAYLLFLRDGNLRLLGVFVAPVSLCFMVAAQFFGTPQIAKANRWVLSVHVTSNLLGVGLFLLAGAVAGFYLAHARLLRNKRAGTFGVRLPPLDTLDVTAHRLLLAAFLLLTIGVISGSAFARQLGHGSVGMLLRAALAYGTWLLLAALLAARSLAGWTGRRAAWGAIAGALAILAVMGLYMVHAASGVPS